MINESNASPGTVGENGSIITDRINKWGAQIDIDAADATLGQVVWPVKATVQQYIFLDALTQLYATSTSAADAIDGTGARTLGVTYQNITSEEFVILDMDGVANVALPETSLGSFRLSVETSGSSNTNVGQIQIVDGSANIYATIEIGEGQTQIAVQRIPNNRQGTIKSHKVDYARTAQQVNDAGMRLRIRKPDGTIITKWDPTIGSAKPEDKKDYFVAGISVNPGEWVYWECISVSADNTPIRGSFDIELEAIR